MQERRPGTRRGARIVDVNTASDHVQIQRPDGTIITIGPAYPKRRTETRQTSTKAVDRPISKVDGAKMSLFPLLEKALSDFPRLLPPEPGFFASLKASSPFTSEEAVNLLRRHEYSVERTTEEVIKDFVELSGTKGDVPDSSRTQIADLLRPLVHELYIATTEVRPGRSK